MLSGWKPRCKQFSPMYNRDQKLKFPLHGTSYNHHPAPNIIVINKLGQSQATESVFTRFAMEEYEQFELVFGERPDVAYDKTTIDRILRNRRTLENELFFDRLLKALGVSQGSSAIFVTMYLATWC